MTRANQLPDIVEEMLLDAGHAQNAELRAALLALGSLASLPAPAPRGELAVLLGESEDESADCADGVGGAPETPPDELAKRRRLHASRPTVFGLALIAGMGLGVGGVAASSPVPGHSGSLSMQHLLEDWAPAWSFAAPKALGSLLPPHAVDGRDAETPVQGEPQPGVSEGGVTGGELPPATASVVKDPSAPPLVPEVAVPNTPVHATQGNSEAQRGIGHGAAADSAKRDAGAAGREKEGAAAGLPEQAVGQNQGAQGESNHLAGAAPGARVDSGPAVLGHGADAAGAAVKHVPGTKWLQKFSR